MTNETAAKQLRKLADELDPPEGWVIRCSSCKGTSNYRRPSFKEIEFIHHCHPKDCHACGHIHAPGYTPEPAVPQPAPSVYGCDPSEMPIPEGWERVDGEWFRWTAKGDFYLDMNGQSINHASENERNLSNDLKRIIVRRKPSPSEPKRRMQGNPKAMVPDSCKVEHDHQEYCDWEPRCQPVEPEAPPTPTAREQAGLVRSALRRWLKRTPRPPASARTESSPDPSSAGSTR